MLLLERGLGSKGGWSRTQQAWYMAAELARASLLNARSRSMVLALGEGGPTFAGLPVAGEQAVVQSLKVRKALLARAEDGKSVARHTASE